MRHVTALVLYAGAMLALFGPQILTTMGQRLLAGGNGDDALIFAWSLRWWPHAIAHATNPLLTGVVWAPTGFTLADATTIPVPSVALAPVTLTAGPVVAYNVLALLGPPLAAWTAYLLCHRLTRSWAAALAGGFVFGFSAYQWGQLIGGHPNLSLVFLIPVACYLVVRRLEGSIGVRPFVALLALVLVLQFGISTEVVATFTMMAVVTAVAGVLLAPGPWRRRVLEAAGWSVVSFAIAAVVVSPYLYYAFAYPQPVKAFHPIQLSSDLANFAVPNLMTWIGTSWFPGVSRSFGDILGQTNA